MGVVRMLSRIVCSAGSAMESDGSASSSKCNREEPVRLVTVLDGKTGYVRYCPDRRKFFNATDFRNSCSTTK